MIRKPVFAPLLSLRVFVNYGLARTFCSKMDFNIISQENIKPFSQTPNPLKAFKLSFLDQIAPPHYLPSFVFFFPSSDHHPKNEEKLAGLRDALSKTLTQFYPLAGRVKYGAVVDCNDEGALYMKAEVSQDMLGYLQRPETESLHHFFPCQPIYKGPLDLAPQVAIKVNTFSCGGIAIGICHFHKIIDACTITDFVKQWVAIARGDCHKVDVYAHNMAASLFRANEQLLNQYIASMSGNVSFKQMKRIVKRFVFDAAAISTFKAKATSYKVPNPTRTEVLSGFIWKPIINASREVSSSAVFNVVNLRSRMKSPLPDYSLGNLVWWSSASLESSEDTKLHHLVELLRKSVTRLDSDCVQKFIGEKGHEELGKNLEEIQEMFAMAEQRLSVSSVAKMGWYEVDFGWGKPSWVAVEGLNEIPIANSVVVLMETPASTGMEAWLSLYEEDMLVFEQDPELLSYATVNPSVVSNTLTSN